MTFSAQISLLNRKTSQPGFSDLLLDHCVKNIKFLKPCRKKPVKGLSSGLINIYSLNIFYELIVSASRDNGIELTHSTGTL